MRYFYHHAYSLSSKNIWRDKFKYESVSLDLKADLHHKSLAANTGSFWTGDRCCIAHAFPYDTAVVTKIPTTKKKTWGNELDGHQKQSLSPSHEFQLFELLQNSMVR